MGKARWDLLRSRLSVSLREIGLLRGGGGGWSDDERGSEMGSSVRPKHILDEMFCKIANRVFCRNRNFANRHYIFER